MESLGVNAARAVGPQRPPLTKLAGVGFIARTGPSGLYQATQLGIRELGFHQSAPHPRRSAEMSREVECLDGVVMWLQRVSTNDVNEPAYRDLVKVMAPYINVRGYGWSGPLAVFKAEFGPSAGGDSDG